MSSVSIEQIPSKPRYIKKFIEFAWEIYRGDPNWVPPLIIDQMNRLNPKKDPYHQHSQSQLFWAKKNGQIVGRISASIDENHNIVHQEKTGFFGFFECIQDYEVAKALFDAAGNWLQERGMEIMRGPASFTSNQEWSLLIDGFDKPPCIMMTYNPDYYIELIDRYGFKKAKDLYAFYLSIDETLNPRIIRISEKIKKRHGITLRSMNMKNYDHEIQIIKNIYRTAWEKNWGFIPLTDDEIQQLAVDMKQIIVPDLMLFAEVEGEPVGFSATVPDMNQALKKINGRLFPFGLLKLLYYKNKVDNARLTLLGIIAGYRKRGIDSLFYVETFQRVKALGYKGGEISWTLEDNVLINRAIESMAGEHYKTYRVYDYPLK